MKILKNDLNTFFKMDVNHASFYSLIVSPGTLFFNNKIKEIDEDKSCEYYLYILNEMKKHGFERYEVSNYARKGYECKHNLTYWKNKEYVGVGLNSSGYVNNIRYVNTTNFSDYIIGKNDIKKEEITYKQLEEYYLITNLRLSRGFSLKEYKKIFGIEFLEKYKGEVELMMKKKQVCINGGNFACTNTGLLVLDLVLLRLFEHEK